MVAYRLPNRRADGFLSLSAFDATVAYDSIRIRSLPADLQLTDAKNRAEPTRSAAERSLALARAKLAAAHADRGSLRARIDAEKAKYGGAESEQIVALSKAAARAQVVASKHAAIVETLGDVDDKKLKSAQKRIEEADKQLSVDAFSANYKPIRASRKALETPAHKEADYPAVYSPVSTGRRLALAKWIVSRENPLTARVAVNQVWMRHFGQPLVESVFDFGLRAKQPVHQDVLDMLAYELMESGWSFRHLHRMIVNSETYMLSSSTLHADPATIKADPQNLFLWRMNARRMESQVVRDSLLSVAGELDPTTGGPSIDPKSPSNRRSIYFLHSRDQQDRFLTMFDDADLLQCYRRSESVVPQQALALSNSKLAIESAQKIAARIQSHAETDDWSAFVTIAFETLIARSPTEQERKECDAFRSEMLGLLSESNDPESRLRERFVHAIFNHNDFIAIR